MIIVERHPRRVRDDFGDRLATNDPAWIYQKGTPLPLRHICSEEHLKEIIAAGQAYLDEKYGKPEPSEPISDDLVSQLSAKDITIDQLQAKVEELSKSSNNPLQREVDNLKMELEASGAEIKRLENELKLALRKPVTPAKSGKGGKKK